MHELVTPLWWVELDDPVDVRNVNASCGEVSRQEHCTASASFSIDFSLSELLVDLCPLLLVDLPVQLAHEMGLALLLED